MKVTATPTPNFSLPQLHLYVLWKEGNMPVVPLTNSEMFHSPPPPEFQFFLGANCATYTLLSSGLRLGRLRWVA